MDKWKAKSNSENPWNQEENKSETLHCRRDKRTKQILEELPQQTSKGNNTQKHRPVMKQQKEPGAKGLLWAFHCQQQSFRMLKAYPQTLPGGLPKVTDFPSFFIWWRSTNNGIECRESNSCYHCDCWNSRWIVFSLKCNKKSPNLRKSPAEIMEQNYDTCSIFHIRFKPSIEKGVEIIEWTWYLSQINDFYQLHCYTLCVFSPKKLTPAPQRPCCCEF